MYGYDINQIPHITDTTPSPIKIAILFIMILLLYIAYEMFLILWNNKRMEQLLSCKRRLKNYKAEKTQITNTKTKKRQPKERQYQRKVDPGETFSDEEKEILKSLGR